MLARSFHLDSLLKSGNEQFKKVGESMGAILMVKVPDLELPDIVTDDYSMEKINQALIKYVLNSQIKNAKQIASHDEHLDDLQAEVTELSERIEKVMIDTPALAWQKLEAYDRSIKGSLDVMARDIALMKQ